MYRWEMLYSLLLWLDHSLPPTTLDGWIYPISPPSDMMMSMILEFMVGNIVKVLITSWKTGVACRLGKNYAQITSQHLSIQKISLDYRGTAVEETPRLILEKDNEF